jgi:hypothetical protein
MTRMPCPFGRIPRFTDLYRIISSNSLEQKVPVAIVDYSRRAYVDEENMKEGFWRCLRF